MAGGAGARDPLVASEIHGFLTCQDLNFDKLMAEAGTRWFRPNEIYAVLANHARFKVHAQPIDKPVVRNFRKDGHTWKKKKDGKTVQEAHEKLKIGNEEKVHVYYARGEDDPNFFRRCYWLLDKELERIVLVHYRQTSEAIFSSPDNVVSEAYATNPVLNQVSESYYGALNHQVNQSPNLLTSDLNSQSKAPASSLIRTPMDGFSLDFRDSSGWTALHWAAYHGREKMVAALLSAGANPSLVTDPTHDAPGGHTAADLAAKQGFDGLAAYLAEKGLTAHFEAMSLSKDKRSASRTQSIKQYSKEFENLSEQELCLRESLAAYRNAADAASNIQAALRERTLKLQTKAIQLANPEIEAATIVAAMKIQHAFRNYNRKKVMRAAARIQSHFRTWQMRRNFMNMRRQAIKIQAAYRGHQVRRQYRKVIWSVGVVEKAILRWRKKRKGLRGIATGMPVAMATDTEAASTAEEDYYQVGRQQAEDRFNRSVVRVQALFRSHRAQQEYRRMKVAHEEAKVEFSQK
nr:unnamed protein product [Digitaria exilis]